jgi:hypothetical protein
VFVAREPKAVEVRNPNIWAILLHPMICSDLAAYFLNNGSRPLFFAEHMWHEEAHYDFATELARVNAHGYTYVELASHPMLGSRHGAFLLGVEPHLMPNNVLDVILVIP